MRDTGLPVKLVVLAIAMFGFGFALVPVYDVFCDLTGFGGRTAAGAETVVEQPGIDRLVKLEFIASVDRSARFEFHPAVGSLQVHPGRIYATSYFARNLRDAEIVSQAVPSVAPGLAAQYLKKIECFCFTEQTFEAREGRDLGVTFMIDPGLPAHIDTLTLSYALFAAEKPK
jgi:cytochrome c oxidase assembly protein subunit 11